MHRILPSLFWILSLSIAISSWRLFLAPISLVMEHMAHYERLVPAAFWAHIIGAPLALALAPFQLWQGLRRKRPTLHRWLGRIYGVSVLVSGIGSLIFLPHFLGIGAAAVGFALLAIAWIGTTGWGILCAMRGDISAHRRWMLRSVALSFAAVTLRLIMGPLVLAGWSVVETYCVTAWLSWLLNLAVVELWLRKGSMR